MNSFRYQAADSTGKIVTGQLEADSAHAAMAQLRGQGLTPLEIKAQTNSSSTSGVLIAAKLSSSDLAWATRQMASMLGASLPLEEALSATVDQAERPHIARTLSAVRTDVRSGMRLADALA